MLFFFFNDTATTEIYTLSLHDALPIYINPDSLNKNPAFTNVVVVEGNVKTVHIGGQDAINASGEIVGRGDIVAQTEQVDRKSTRLNSSHANISYAVFCLKKQKVGLDEG